MDPPLQVLDRPMDHNSVMQVKSYVHSIMNGDRVDDHLMHLILVLKQFGRIGQALEAIRVFQHLGTRRTEDYVALLEENTSWTGFIFVPTGMYAIFNKIKDQGNSFWCLFYASTSVWEAMLSVDISIQQLLDGYWGDVSATGVRKDPFIAYMNTTYATTSQNYPPSSAPPLTKQSFNSAQFMSPFYQATWTKVGLGTFDNYEDAMMACLHKNNYLFCFVNASDSFKKYSGGFFHHHDCMGPLNHGVVITSFGHILTQKGMTHYWIVKNSYGASWGYDGLMYMERGSNCLGIGISAYYPVPSRQIVEYPILKDYSFIEWTHYLTQLHQVALEKKECCIKCLVTWQQICEEFSKKGLTQETIHSLKVSLRWDFYHLYKMCIEVLSAFDSNFELIQATLVSISASFSWVSIDDILEFQSILLKALHKLFAQSLAHGNLILDCLRKFTAVHFEAHKDMPFVNSIYDIFIKEIKKYFPLSTNRSSPIHFSNVSIERQVMIQSVALFLIGHFKLYIQTIEHEGNADAAFECFEYLICISYVDDKDIFKDCLKFWSSTLETMPRLKETREQMHASMMCKLRLLMIRRMAKPEEVLIVEDINGDIVRENMTNNEALMVYKMSRETLVYLTQLDHNDTEKKILGLLNKQFNGEDWSRNDLNTLCWTIGSLSGVMTEDQKTRILEKVKSVLGKLWEIKTNKDDKAVISSNISYIIGQYPSFFCADWKHIKPVVLTLLEFMRTLHPAVKDMACNTFRKIVQKDQIIFVTVQGGENEPFVSELVKHLSTMIGDFALHNLYEIVGHIIKIESNSQKRDEYLAGLMELPNQRWAAISSTVSTSVDPEYLMNADTVQVVLGMLKIYTSAATSLGTIFLPQIIHLFRNNNMSDVYRIYGKVISRICAEGTLDLKINSVELCRSVKRETIKLVETVLAMADAMEFDITTQQFLIHVMDFVRDDYAINMADAREPDVLLLFAKIINKYKGAMEWNVPLILDGVFSCTIQMLSTNVERYLEHCLNLVLLLEATAKHCFHVFVGFPDKELEAVLNFITFAFNRTEIKIAEIGLKLLLVILEKYLDPELWFKFYSKYTPVIWREIAKVLTDTFHKPDFNLHVLILHKLFYMAVEGPLASSDYSVSYQDLAKDLFDLLFPYGTIEVGSFQQLLFQSRNDFESFRKIFQDFPGLGAPQ